VVFSSRKKEKVEHLQVQTESVEHLQVQTESPLMEEEISPYRYGYLKGQRNFLAQMGKDVPPLPKVAKYTRSEPDEISKEDEEEMMKGYIDGYHKTGELMYCPKCTY
jgi:hypothetical protein